jgi:hypothetical protein
VSTVSKTRTHILVASMPKSGSTFLSDVIASLPDFRRARLSPTYDQREQELDEYCLEQADAFNYVAQQHVRYSGWTQRMLDRYEIKPVVLVRNIFDIIVSLRDHLRNEGPVWFNFFVEPQHTTLDDATLELMIARLAIPWYINFYMGWRQIPGVMFVTYEALIADPDQTVREVLAFAGADLPPSDVTLALKRVRALEESRLNVGVVGRGAALRPETINAVLDLIDFYPAAAQDSYIQSLKAQAETALADQDRPSLALAMNAHRSLSFQRSLRKKGRRLVARRIIPAVLVVAAIAYWIWPTDLLPDAGRIGYLDDCVTVLLFAFLAGRFSRRKPGLSAQRPGVWATLAARALPGGMNNGAPGRTRTNTSLDNRF